MIGRVHYSMAAVAAPEQDVQLMLRVKAGDVSSFDLLLHKYRAPVVHFLYRMVQNQAVAEELAQEVFLRIYRSRTSYEATAKFITWLFRISSNVALNWLRDGRGERRTGSLDNPDTQGRVQQITDRSATAEQILLSEVRRDEVRRAIRALPAKQRAAVLMHKYEEMEYSQIAKVLSCSESAVKSLLFRAYESLRSRLSPVA